jgi:hypothetical protein
MCNEVRHFSGVRHSAVQSVTFLALFVFLNTNKEDLDAIGTMLTSFILRCLFKWVLLIQNSDR